MPGVCTMEMSVAFDRAQASCRLAAKSKNLKQPLVSMNDYVDLVKSHLMYAVREEVEVLKEQIKELMERLGQLEYENGVLRAAATPETLAMLAQSQPTQPPPPSSSS